MGGEFVDGDHQTQRSVLGRDDEQEEATDQDEINSGPGARDQNKENVRAKETNSVMPRGTRITRICVR